MVTALYRAFVRDVASAGLPAGPSGPPKVVTEQDVADLPPVVRRYLAFMGVVGRPIDWSFTVGMAGKFRRTPQDAWMPMQAWQYNTSLSVARVFTMRLTFAKVLPLVGHDTYIQGTGRMLGKLLGAVTVVDGSGPEFDMGELVTYLNDAIMLAPSMLLGPATRWVQVTDDAFDVTLADGGIEVTGRVFVDKAGAPVDFSTTDRFAALPEGLIRAEWRTPVPGWTSLMGRPFPQPGHVTWQLPDGPFTYVDGGFVAGSITYNQPPPS